VLAEGGLSVAIVEAQSRIGGRVRSIEVLPQGIPVELGAEFIHGRALETYAILREIGEDVVGTDAGSWALDEHGQLREADDDDFYGATRLFDSVSDLAHDVSVDSFLKQLADRGVDAEKIRLARSFVEGFDAADTRLAGVRGIAFELQSGVDAQASRPRNGYAPMFAYLHEQCTRANVRFYMPSPVRTIAWKRGGVRLGLSGESGPAELRARSVIVTVPVGVLHDRSGVCAISFDPPLPRTKREALDLILMGSVVKVALRFRTPFWEELHGGIYRDAGFFRDVRGQFPTYWTQVPMQRGIVIAWAGGPKAAALHGEPEETIVARALDGFGGLFNARESAKREFEGGIMHDWFTDPHACGAYSYLAVGGERARLGLADPLDDTLFFAGEATSNDGQGGTVNGALATGERAAREVLAALHAK
jgi:monoamine oxidase